MKPSSTFRRLLMAGVVASLIATSANAQSDRAKRSRDHGPVSVSISPLGFTQDTPDTYQLAFDIGIEVNENLSFGPLLQVGVASNLTLVGLTANGKYRFDVFDGAKLRKLRPFAQAGIGFSHIDVPGADKSAFLANMGFGAEYAISEHVSLASDVLFNLTPSAPLGNTYYFSWQFVTVRYHF